MKALSQPQRRPNVSENERKRESNKRELAEHSGQPYPTKIYSWVDACRIVLVST